MDKTDESSDLFNRLLSNSIKNLVNNNANKKFLLGSYIILFFSILK